MLVPCQFASCETPEVESKIWDSKKLSATPGFGLSAHAKARSENKPKLNAMYYLSISIIVKYRERCGVMNRLSILKAPERTTTQCYLVPTDYNWKDNWKDHIVIPLLSKLSYKLMNMYSTVNHSETRTNQCQHPGMFPS